MLRTLQGIARERYVPPYAMALVYAGLGQPDPVFEWLDRAYLVRDVHLVRLGDHQVGRFSRRPTVSCAGRTLRLHAHGENGRPHRAIEANAAVQWTVVHKDAVDMSIRSEHCSPSSRPEIFSSTT